MVYNNCCGAFLWLYEEEEEKLLAFWKPYALQIRSIFI
jgi:hypothetical protein